jgi:hypothetical protein
VSSKAVGLIPDNRSRNAASSSGVIGWSGVKSGRPSHIRRLFAYANAGKYRGQGGQLRVYADREFLTFWGFAAAGGFLTAAFAAVGLFALTFQAQLEEVLPKLAVVHDSSLRREELHSGMLRGLIGRNIAIFSLSQDRSAKLLLSWCVY